MGLKYFLYYRLVGEIINFIYYCLILTQIPISIGNVSLKRISIQLTQYITKLPIDIKITGAKDFI